MLKSDIFNTLLLIIIFLAVILVIIVLILLILRNGEALFEEIKSKLKVKKSKDKPIDTRPINVQLDEVYGGKKH